MVTISDRISQVVKDSGLTKTAFAKRINISQPYLSQLCGGGYTPSDRTIADICREFHVRREWLENGEEPMKYPEADEGLRYIDELMADDPGPFASLIRAAMVAYCEADPADRPALDRFAKKFLKDK